MKRRHEGVRVFWTFLPDGAGLRVVEVGEEGLEIGKDGQARAVECLAVTGSSIDGRGDDVELEVSEGECGRAVLDLGVRHLRLIAHQVHRVEGADDPESVERLEVDGEGAESCHDGGHVESVVEDLLDGACTDRA